MHPDIEKAIGLIDRKIAGLQRVKQTLLDEFGEKAVSVDNKTFLSPRKTKKVKKTRKVAIMKLLHEEGPLARSEILQKTGFPLGTVSFILNDKTTFSNKDGKWQLIEEIESKQIPNQ
jgi:hypothetical protein